MILVLYYIYDLHNLNFISILFNSINRHFCCFECSVKNLQGKRQCLQPYTHLTPLSMSVNVQLYTLSQSPLVSFNSC